MKYLTLFLPLLIWIAPLQSSGVDPQCLADKILAGEGSFGTDAYQVEIIGRFQRSGWSRYSLNFESREGKPALLERVGEKAMPTLEAVKMMKKIEKPLGGRIPGYSLDHFVLKRSVIDQFGTFDFSDSQGIAFENIYMAARRLTHQANPSAEDIYEAMKKNL